jgi:hypothetical protein
MEGRFSHGIRFVLSNCTDPARDVEFNRWYTDVHLPDILGTGLAAHARRYRDVAAAPKDGRYLAIYEFQREDLEAAGQELSRHAERFTREGRIHPALEVAHRGMWRRIGGEFRSAKSGTARVTGLLAVGSNCSDAAREAEFNAWYNDTHIPDILASRLFHTAYRFETVSAGAWPGRYLALYETDAADPAVVAEELVQVYRPRWMKAGRYTDTLQLAWRGVFQRI